MPIVEIKNLNFFYKDKQVLNEINLTIDAAEIFGFLGPNGSGKTTLFRILSTYFEPSSGSVTIGGLDIAAQTGAIRKKIGVVFQSPSLDGKLTVRENLVHQAHLYGLSGQRLNQKIEDMMARLSVSDRRNERVEKLSGGLKRRVELAKGLLHEPEVLILDEPSTGLDPGARIDLWKYLKALNQDFGVTLLVTTHLMEEAEHCRRIAILNHGKIISAGTPEVLKKEVGGDVLVIQAKDPFRISEQIRDKFHVNPIEADGLLQIEHEHAARFAAQLVEAFPGQIDSMTFRRPSLEDVFIHKTGHRFWGSKE